MNNDYIYGSKTSSQPKLKDTYVNMANIQIIWVLDLKHW